MKNSIGKGLALMVIIVIGLAAIYLVASNGGNNVVSQTAEVNKPKAEEETKSKVVATGDQPRIQFEETVYDWGTVYQNEKVPHVFKFKNVGKADLVIENVKSS